MSSVDQNNSIMNKQGTVNKDNSSNFYMNTTGMNHTFSTNMKSNFAKKTISKSPIPTRKLESVQRSSVSSNKKEKSEIEGKINSS